MSSSRNPTATAGLVFFALLSIGTAARAQTSETPAASPEGVVILDLATWLRGDGAGMTADEVARRALESAPSMDSARSATRRARAAAARAYLGFFPRFEITARYTRLSPVTNGSLSSSITADQEALLRDLVAGVDDPEAQALFTVNLESQLALANFRFPVILDQFSIGGTLSYPISDVFFAVLPGYEAAERAVDASEDQLDARAAEIAQQAREAFYNWARARAALAVATSTVATIEAQERVVAATVDAGTTARVDLMRIQAQLASARVAALRAEGAVAAAEEAIRTLIHDHDAPMGSVGEDLLAPLPALTESRDELVERALAGRPEARALEHVIAMHSRAIESAEGGRYPHLIASGALSFDNPSQRVFPQTDRFIDTWSVSVILSWSPNDFFSAELTAEESRASREGAEADLEALADGVRMQVIQAYESYRAASAALEAANLAIEASEESVRVRTEQYRAGTGTITELMAATADLARAQLDLVSAAIDARIALTQLHRATGDDRSWELLD